MAAFDYRQASEIRDVFGSCQVRYLFGVVGSGDFADYLAGTRVERLNRTNTGVLVNL